MIFSHEKFNDMDDEGIINIIRNIKAPILPTRDDKLEAINNPRCPPKLFCRKNSAIAQKHTKNNIELIILKMLSNLLVL
tara:strand:- start:321 stop:557 length:237 start_codon:yes stop_codon:yes gene_type:complete